MNNLGQDEIIVRRTGQRVIVLAEANPGNPLRGDFERMARRRFQNPKPFREGKWWWINPWQDDFKDGRLTRKRKRMKVAEATVPEREVLKISAEMLRPMNHDGVCVRNGRPAGKRIARA